MAHLDEADRRPAAVRSASMMPLMPSPGRPKTTSHAPVLEGLDEDVGGGGRHQAAFRFARRPASFGITSRS